MFGRTLMTKRCCNPSVAFLSNNFCLSCVACFEIVNPAVRRYGELGRAQIKGHVRQNFDDQALLKSSCCFLLKQLLSNLRGLLRLVWKSWILDSDGTGSWEGLKLKDTFGRTLTKRGWNPSVAFLSSNCCLSFVACFEIVNPGFRRHGDLGRA